MDINIAAQFNKLSGITAEEVLGNILIRIDTGTLCVFDVNTPSNGLHFHNCYEMCIVTGGTGEFLHNGVTYPLQEGDVFIADPGVLHEIRLSKGRSADYAGSLHLVFCRVYIHADGNSVPGTYEEKMLREFMTAHSVISRSQKQLFSYLYFIEQYTSYNCREEFGLHQALKNLMLSSLFSLVGSRGDYERHAPQSAVDLAIEYIGANLHRHIRIGEVAANACTSVRNLQYLFRKNLNRSVVDYINQRKAAVAAGYLKMNFRVAEVGSIIGVNDSAQFSRMFKKYLGMPPKEYQLSRSPGEMVSGASFENPIRS